MKRRILSILLALCMLLTMLPITAMAVGATATNIQVTEAEYYATGALEKITAQFGWAQAGVTGRLVLQTKRLRSAGENGTDSIYGDFTNFGHYAGDFDSFDDVLAYDQAQDGVFGIVAYSDETVVTNGTDNNTATFEFESTDLPLDKNGLYYVYFWTYYREMYYPDNLFLVIQVKDGVVSYTPAIEGNGDRNSYDQNAFEEIVTEETYNVYVFPGANMTLTSGAQAQSGLNGSMTPVVFTANAGYEFPEDYAVTPVNGIMVRRDSASQITVLGKPTADAIINLPAASAAAPVQPTEQEILNDNWPYGKNMTSTAVTLTVAVSNPANATYAWYQEIDGEEDMQVGTAKDLVLSSPVSGSCYYCVVDGSLTSETVKIVKPDSSWTKPYNSYYITNGIVAYMVNGVKFDVVGLYTKNDTNYMLNTSYSSFWSMYSTDDAEPSAGTSDQTPLDDLWVAFNKEDDCAVYFVADLADGQQAFAFGADTQLGNNVTSGSYADSAALIAELEGSVLKHISLIGAASEEDAKASDPSFVIAPVEETPADRFWIGYYSNRNAYAYNNNSGTGYTTTNINGTDVTTAVENHDSGMTMSWLNVESGGTVGFLFKVGKVADTGATETPAEATVTFYANGQGTAPAAQTVAVGQTAAEPTAPTATGYTFGGWYTDADCTTAWNFSDAVDEDLDLYAKWTVNNYTVTWIVDGEEDVDTYAYGAAVTVPADPEKVGHTFAGWGASVPATMPAENLTFTAQWTVNNYTVTWIVDGEEDVDTYAYGAAVTVPADPEKVGHTFAGWGASVPATMPAENLTFTAQWTVNVYNIIYNTENGEICGEYPTTYTYGETVTLPDRVKRTGYLFRGWLNEDGEVITEIPAGTVGDVEVTANWILNPLVLLPFLGSSDPENCARGNSCPLCDFTDLDPKAWYHDGIHFALEEGIMNGTGEKTFSPNAATSRAMVVTILYRMEGSPAASMQKAFSDVSYDTWYGAAVSWAAANGIVEGYEDGTFRPNTAITREQLAAILYRYAAYKGDWTVDYHTENVLAAYPDAASVSGYAVKALNWAVAEGLINGMDGALNPRGTATRAQAAAILYRYLAK